MSDVTQLGYVGFEVSDLAAWSRFGTEVLGLMQVEVAGGIGFRLDSYRHRILLTEGASDDLSVLGFEVAGPGALARVLARLQGARHDVTEGTEGEAAARGVERLVKLRDPAGNPLELYYGPSKAYLPFSSELIRSGFVAENLGLGHAVLRAQSKAESMAFFIDVLGLRLSDEIICEIYGYPVDIAFLHTNARHHSLALGENQPKRIHHLMLEVGHIDDVGACYDRTIRAGLKVVQTLGRHPNDRMVSFYAMTPSGFQFEMGTGGRVVDVERWTPTTYDHISDWGHHPPALIAGKMRGAKR